VKITLVHLSGPRRGAVDAVERLPAAIGSDPGSAVAVPGVAGTHALLVERQGMVVLADAGSGRETLVLDEPVSEATLRDGDVLELGRGGPTLRYHREDEASPRPSAALSRPGDARRRVADTGTFLRAVVKETAARTSRLLRLSLAVVLALGAVALGYSQWRAHRLRQEVGQLREQVAAAAREQRLVLERVEEERRRADRERLDLEARIAGARAREKELDERLREAQSAAAQQVRDELTTTRQRLLALESERAAGERVIREFGGGVALVQGSYAFRDAEGRGLRVVLDGQGQPRRHEDGGPVLGVDGTGPLYAPEYFGTGFLVDRQGLLLTNRHVAQPWWGDATADRCVKEGFTPRFAVFRAFFPREREAFELRTERVHDTVDLAVLRLDLGKRRVPVLPLDRTGRGAVPGQPVVVLGYPTGLEALLAKAEPSVVQEILSDSGMSFERVTQDLSRKGLIRPSSTQGHIGDVTKTDVVFDAPTTQGGSGGPVLNRDGRVVAVEYAVLQQFAGSSFGVPVGYALELLKPPPGARRN
jgi:S1-C subfamily serine protease